MMHKCIELGKRVATREGTKAKINPVSLAEKTFRLHRTNTALAIVFLTSLRLHLWAADKASLSC